MKRIRLATAVLLALLAVTPILAQQQVTQSESGLLTLDTIFTYTPKFPGELQWQADGSGYFMLEPSPTVKERLDLVRYDAASGERRVLVAAEKLVPQGTSAPLVIEQFDFSPDAQSVLIFTNSARVWRSNTRGDYWVLDLKNSKLHKLGGEAKPATLMFAKFSPDSTRVGYVRENNIYVESLADGRITRLTADGSRTIVNGTFDWVYEEELFCRDG